MTTKRGESGSISDDAHSLDDSGFNDSVLLEDGGDDLASDVPESMTVSIDLPAPVRTVPDDELAVTISDDPVSPELLSGVDVSSLSISMDSSLIEASDDVVDDVEYAPLPAVASDDPQSRRDRLRGEVSSTPESANMLTADRLIDVKRRRRPAPEGGWPSFVYSATLHLVNLGDSAKARARKELDARIDKQFEGGTRFVPVLTRKGGVGKTTVTSLLGMALSDVREDRIIAIDANPDRGTLSERVNKQTRSTVRDVVTHAASITSFNDFSQMVSRDETRLDILASDTDPLLSEAFDENDYNVVADLAARFYSIALTDCGTGIVHSVMRATLQRADSLVIVSGGSVDEARLASETLTWLESNGYADLVRNAVVAINTATQGTSLVKLDEIESHFQSRVREIVRIPYDPHLAAGSVIDYKNLRTLTKDAARRLAAIVMDGLPSRRAD
ncbi:MinD/ParA family ATP-binding protein [Salinibacterium hongtaonis]|uniref:MinD/ParA family ATP-binding protein n=1 Tax=Homoserinimonas hongtaonis TaxID=2079791 RepID=UPI001F544C3A|nr:MinD/ParA family protein [Salinibacterium hongtaonis]